MIKYAILVIVLSIYYYIVLIADVSFFHPTRLHNFSNHFLKNSLKPPSNSYLDFEYPHRDRSQIGSENATLVMLVRNRELDTALESIRSLEDRFNKNYRYPWIFFNDEPFTDEFIEKTTLFASSKTYYEIIPSRDWDPPRFINQTKFDESIQSAIDNNVIYGHSKSYRNMCHYNSGYFYKQKILQNYDWYFRVEPNVQYLCDFQYDPFELLRVNNKIYGFVITLHDYENTLPSLWSNIEKFMQQYPHLIHKNNSLDFITSFDDLNLWTSKEKSKSPYNLCHFWSNFEIANLNFFRSDAYNTYFDFLDKTGGFYYERWGDAPVHSIALNILVDKNQIHHFEDLGYYHPPFMTCPTSDEIKASKRCICKADYGKHRVDTPIDYHYFSCLPKWWRYGSGKRFLNEIDRTFNV
jgi:mannosyltransferase